MTAAVVVVHEPVPELSACLEALIPQVDELVVVDNLGRATVQGVPVIQNEQPKGFAANANRGIRETTAPFVVVANPDTKAAPDAVAVLRDFAERHPRAGIVGPELRHPDGTLNPSRRRFPTVSGTLVRRTPLRRVLGGTQRSHYGLDVEPTEPVAGGLAARRVRPPAPRDVGGARRLRRGLPPLRRGHRPRLPSREGRAGSAGTSRRRRSCTCTQAVTDRRLLTRRTLWHWRGIARFVRKHPERLKAL